MFIYYVYAYVRQSNNTPYYIGKGKNDRAYAYHKGISVPKDRSKIVFLETNLSEIGALALERRYIQWYGRKDISTGILLNRTDGGDGLTQPSKETRFEIGKANRGRKFTKERIDKRSKSQTGLKRSAETRAKMSASQKGRKFPGRKLSQEHKDSIRKSWIKRKLDKNHTDTLL